MDSIGVVSGVLVALAKPLGSYMARVLEGKPCGLDRALGWCERGIYRLAGVDPQQEMRWRTYAFAVLAFNAVGHRGRLSAAAFAGRRCRSIRKDLPGTTPDLAFNTAVSFATNTNWQSYGGETTLSYLVADAGADGAELRLGGDRHGGAGGADSRPGAALGDDDRQLLGRSRALDALHLAAAVDRLGRGARVAGRDPELSTPTRRSNSSSRSPVDGSEPTTTQTLPMGPAASQIAIKQLGTNGGGFFNVNSAHPFENPTPLSNFLEMLAILLIPAALCYTFGEMVGDVRQGWAVLAAMLVIFVPLTIGVIAAEQSGVPQYAAMGADDVSVGDCKRAATWKARKFASASPTRRSGRRRRRPRRTAASTRCTIRSRRSAG